MPVSTLQFLPGDLVMLYVNRIWGSPQHIAYVPLAGEAPF